jgi:hypothetical protein
MPKRKPTPKLVPSVSLHTEIDCYPLGEMIAEGATHEQGLEVIKGIDAGFADYEFTLMVARWAVAELKKSSPPEEPFTYDELEPSK